MTVIEQQTMNAIISACQSYNRSNKIDWEQRRYEIAKEVLASLASTAYYEGYEEAQAEASIRYADYLINHLKQTKND